LHIRIAASDALAMQNGTFRDAWQVLPENFSISEKEQIQLTWIEADLGNFGAHFFRISEVFTKSIDELAKENEENGNGNTMHTRSGSAEKNEHQVITICKGE